MAKVSFGGSAGTSRHVRNITFSVAGTAVPLAAGIIAIPMLLSGLGTEKLGLFSLALGLFGFTGLFDLGLGRALTRTVAHDLAEGRTRSEVAGLMRRGLEAIALLGGVWGVAFFYGAPHFADALHLQDEALRTEVINCVRVLSMLVPVALLASGFNGILEGDRAFRTVNLIRAPIGVATYVAPALIAIESNSLFATVAVLAAVRMVGCFALFAALTKVFPKFWLAPATNAASLWRYSGWLTVSNVIGPVMTSADRYYLATVFPPAAIAPYTVVFDTIYRITAFPFAAISAVFPSLTNPGKTAAELRQILVLAARAGTVFWAVPLLLASLFAEHLLSVWMGAEFAQSSTSAARWIIAGILVNGFALIPFMVLQADGRIVTTIKFHLLELVPYAACLVVLTTKFGIVGAAIAWTSRVILDAFLQFGAARHFYRPAAGHFDRLLICALLGCGAVLAGQFLPLLLRLVVALLVGVFAVRSGLMVLKDARRG